MLIKYEKNQFNYMYRMASYFASQAEEIRDQINWFLHSIEDNPSWLMEDGKDYIVLNLGEREIAVLLYVYENTVFFTAEGQRIMSVCEDKFSQIKKKSRG